MKKRIRFIVICALSLFAVCYSLSRIFLKLPGLDDAHLFFCTIGMFFIGALATILYSFCGWDKKHVVDLLMIVLFPTAPAFGFYTSVVLNASKIGWLYSNRNEAFIGYIIAFIVGFVTVLCFIGIIEGFIFFFRKLGNAFRSSILWKPFCFLINFFSY